MLIGRHSRYWHWQQERTPAKKERQIKCEMWIKTTVHIPRPHLCFSAKSMNFEARCGDSFISSVTETFGFPFLPVSCWRVCFFCRSVSRRSSLNTSGRIWQRNFLFLGVFFVVVVLWNRNFLQSELLWRPLQETPRNGRPRLAGNHSSKLPPCLSTGRLFLLLFID